MCEVAKTNNNECSNDFSDGWIDVEVFHQHFQAHIVNENANHHQQEISEQLYASMKIRIVENDIAHKEKTGWEAYCKRHDERHYVWADHNWAPNEVLFMQDKIVADEINKNVEQGITASAGEVTKSLYGNKLAKRRIEKIYECGNVILQTICFYRSEYKAFVREIDVNNE